MTTYLALLRGINVGGHRVTMELLRALFRDFSFANVRSYIHTGNVFFATDESDRALLTTRIEAHLGAVLGYSVPVFLRTTAELTETLTPNPFSKVEVTPDVRLCVLFTKEPLTCAAALPMRSDNGALEIVRVRPTEVCFAYHLISGRPPDASRLLKEMLGKGVDAGTTRFYGTLLKMLEFGEETQ